MHNVFLKFVIGPEGVAMDKKKSRQSQIGLDLKEYKTCRELWGNFLEKLGGKTRYHSQANSQVERVNQQLGRFLQTFCSDNQKD